MFRCTVFPVAQIMRLDKLVHDTAFGYIELKKIALIEFGGCNQPVFPECHAVDGEIFTERTSIYPAVGKNKIIIGDQAGTFQYFLRV